MSLFYLLMDPQGLHDSMTPFVSQRQNHETMVVVGFFFPQLFLAKHRHCRQPQYLNPNEAGSVDNIFWIFLKHANHLLLEWYNFRPSTTGTHSTHNKITARIPFSRYFRRVARPALPQSWACQSTEHRTSGVLVLASAWHVTVAIRFKCSVTMQGSAARLIWTARRHSASQSPQGILARGRSCWQCSMDHQEWVVQGAVESAERWCNARSSGPW